MHLRRQGFSFTQQKKLTLDLHRNSHDSGDRLSTVIPILTARHAKGILCTSKWPRRDDSFDAVKLLNIHRSYKLCVFSYHEYVELYTMLFIYT